MWEAALLGILQGLTEFLPISSSAHLRIAGEFLPGVRDPGATFTAITQIGTEIAVLVYFRHDLLAIARAWLSWALALPSQRRDLADEDRQQVRLGWLIILGTIPIVVVGYLAQDLIRNSLRSLWIVATVLIVFGLLLLMADWWGKHTKTLSTMPLSDGLAAGLAQTLALIPGVSRSGATIAMGRVLGYQRAEATRFSFLLAVPAVLGSGLYELQTALTSPESAGVFGLGETLLATAVAGLVGFAVIAWLMRYLQTRSFLPFVIYRVALGSALFVLLGLGILDPVSV